MLRAYIYTALVLAIILTWSNAKADHVDLNPKYDANLPVRVMHAVDCLGNTIDITIWDSNGVIVGYHQGDPSQTWFEEFKRVMNHGKDFEVVLAMVVECDQ